MKTFLAALLVMLTFQPALATVQLTPIYANEASNWPLETFAGNGLFRQIARYQQGHPQAIVLNGGEYTLAQLARQLDTRALSRTASGWTLHYPLIIGPGARLILSASTLFIEGRHGGCLINRGKLLIENSSLSSNGDQSSGFIHGWGGSTTRIKNSDLADLGRADYRANGVSVARHRYQGAGTPAQLFIRDSRFSNLHRGVDAEAGSRVSIVNLSISASREQGVVLYNSPAHIEQLQVSDSKGHGLRAGGNRTISIADSQFQKNGGSGLLLEDHTGEIHITQVASLNNQEYGIQIKSQRGQQITRMESLNLTGNGSDGLRLDGSMHITLNKAEISHNHRYAISIQAEDGRQISGNMAELHLHLNRLAALHTGGEGSLRLKGVSLRHGSNQGKYLAGNLAGKEADLLPKLLRNQEVVVPFTESLPTIPLTSPR